MARRRLTRDTPRFPALEWLADASGLQVRMMLVGTRRLLVENHRGIVEFTEARIRLMTRAGILTIDGEHLTLCEVRPDALTVRGSIRVIGLPLREEEQSDD